MKSFRAQHPQGDRAPDTADAPHTVESLAQMSDSELQALLVSEFNKAKAEGTMDNDTLSAFFAQIAPMLTPEQREKMQRLLTLLRR